MIRLSTLRRSIGGGIAMLAVLLQVGCGGGGATNSVTPIGATNSTLSTAVSTITTVKVTAVDYFSGAAITTATLKYKGTAVVGKSGVFSFTASTGTQNLEVTAPSYADYVGAVQATGGSATRIIKLFPISATTAKWLVLVNADRSANGSPAVVLDDMLTIAAFDHASDMAARKYFAHFDTLGFAPTTRSLLLGSITMGSENIAAGFTSYTAADASFMAEKSSLPHKLATDCATYDADAGHFCNIVWKTHNRVGLAAVKLAGSPYTYYYDQEFGAYYGSFDTTVYSPTPAVNTTATLTFLPDSGAAISKYGIGYLYSPTAIAINVLNADPTCATYCPPGDHWYPTMGYTTTPFPLSLTNTSYLYFVGMYSNISTFVGTSAETIFWPGAHTLPTSYTNKTTLQSVDDDVVLQSEASSTNDTGVVAPNPPEMLGN